MIQYVETLSSRYRYNSAPFMIVASAAESTSLHPEATSSVQWVPNASCIVCKIIFSRFCKGKYASLVESEIFHSNWLYENEVITSIDAEV